MITWKQSIDIIWSRPIGFRCWYIMVGTVIGLTLYIGILLPLWLEAMQPGTGNAWEPRNLSFQVGASIPFLIAITVASKLVLRQQDIERIKTTALGRGLSEFFHGKTPATANFVGILAGVAIAAWHVMAWWPLMDNPFRLWGTVFSAFGLLLVTTAHVAAITACFQGGCSSSVSAQGKWESD